MLVRAPQDNLRRRRHLRLDMRRYGHIHGMRKPDLHIQSLSISAVRRATGIVLERHPVPDTNEVERYTEPFRHARYGVKYQRSRRSPHLALGFDLCVLDRDSHDVGLGKVDFHVWLERHRSRSKRTFDGDGRWGRGERDIGRVPYRLAPNVREVGLAACCGRKGANGLPKLRPNDHRMQELFDYVIYTFLRKSGPHQRRRDTHSVLRPNPVDALRCRVYPGRLF